ncbi:hypothetical protein FRC02_007582, partial [Tulasnella sp. 418]
MGYDLPHDGTQGRCCLHVCVRRRLQISMLWRQSMHTSMGKHFSSLKRLPGCPEHLTPGKYAVFVFGDRCSGCLRRVRKIRTHYPLFMRLCGTCYDKRAVTPKYIDTNLVRPGENFPYKSIVLSDQFMPRPGVLVLARRYSLDHATIALQEYRDLYQSNPAIKLPGEARKRYTAESERRVNKLKNIAKRVGKYSNQSKKGYKQSAIYQEIVEKLSEQPEAWTPQDLPTGHPRWKFWMTEHAHLTEKGWIALYKDMKPALVKERANNESTARRARRKGLIKAWYETLPMHEDIFYPTTDNVFSFMKLPHIQDSDVEDEIWIGEFGQSFLPALEDSLRKETQHLVQMVQAWYRNSFSSFLLWNKI